MSIWTSTHLGDVARIRHGFAFSGMTANTDTRVPVVVGIGNFDYAGGFRFGSTTIKRYDGNYPTEFELAPGDVLLAMTCQTPGGEILGIPGAIPDDGQTYLHNQRLGKVEILDAERAHLPFIFQLCRWDVFNQHLFATASGSKILHTSPGRIEEFRFDLPPLAEQRAIAATLGALDDKIESNGRATAAGEALIQALVDSALDESDGDSGTLGDYCTLIKAPVKVGDIRADGNYIGLEHMPRGSIFLTEWERAEGLGSNKTAFRRGDVLFGKLRPYFKKVGIAPVDGVCSTDILAIRPKDPQDLGLVATVAASDALIDSLTAGSTGTRMPRASWKDLADWRVPILTADERTRLAARVTPLIQRLEQLTFETHRLAALRDALLPELLSGRMRVAEAQEVAA